MKKLLNESDVRRFMKYANLGTLTETFVSNLEEEEIEEGYGVDAYKRDMHEEEAEEEMPPVGDEMDDALPPEDMEMGDEEEAADPAMEAAVEKVVSAVVDAMAELPGAPDVTMQSDDQGELAADDADMDPAGVGSMPPEEAEPDLEEDLAAANIHLEEEDDASLEEMINEITRRVAKRLLNKSRA